MRFFQSKPLIVEFIVCIWSNNRRLFKELTDI